MKGNTPRGVMLVTLKKSDMVDIGECMRSSACCVSSLATMSTLCTDSCCSVNLKIQMVANDQPFHFTFSCERSTAADTSIQYRYKFS